MALFKETTSDSSFYDIDLLTLRDCQLRARLQRDSRTMGYGLETRDWRRKD
jgi:hypothetical protein